MNLSKNILCRQFVKTGVLSFSVIARTAVLVFCINQNEVLKKEYVFPVFIGIIIIYCTNYLVSFSFSFSKNSTKASSVLIPEASCSQTAPK